jgi:hypothetical protein
LHFSTEREKSADIKCVETKKYFAKHFFISIPNSI